VLGTDLCPRLVDEVRKSTEADLLKSVGVDSCAAVLGFAMLDSPEFVAHIGVTLAATLTLQRSAALSRWGAFLLYLEEVTT
jgi:hypothetical protein